MRRVLGEVIQLNTFNPIYQPAGAAVIVISSGQPIANGLVDDNYRFEIDLPEGAAGEIEVRLGLQGGSSAYATVVGDDDVFVTLMYNNDAVKA